MMDKAYPNKKATLEFLILVSLSQTLKYIDLLQSSYCQTSGWQNNKLKSGTELVRALIANINFSATINYSKTQIGSGASPDSGASAESGIGTNGNVSIGGVNPKILVAKVNNSKSPH